MSPGLRVLLAELAIAAAAALTTAILAELAGRWVLARHSAAPPAAGDPHGLAVADFRATIPRALPCDMENWGHGW